MDANQIDQFLALNSENLPEEKINELRELLADADDNKANLLNAISLKGKTMMLIISIFLGSYGVDRFMLRDRGYVKEGCFADLTVFNEDEIRAAQPDREQPFGIRMAVVNGVPVLENGKLNEQALKTTGRALRV